MTYEIRGLCRDNISKKSRLSVILKPRGRVGYRTVRIEHDGVLHFSDLLRFVCIELECTVSDISVASHVDPRLVGVTQ